MSTYNYQADSRPRRQARIDVDRDGRSVAVSVEEPTPEQVSEILLAFGALLERERTA